MRGAALVRFLGLVMAVTVAIPGVVRAQTTSRESSDFIIHAGPRAGGSVNADQWTLGAQMLVEGRHTAGLGLEPLFLLGVGGNHVTFRPGLHLMYTFWFDQRHRFGLAPVFGVSAYFYEPVGWFANACVTACRGSEVGIEFGAAARYRWFRLEAVVGRMGLPIVTINLGFDFALLGET